MVSERLPVEVEYESALERSSIARRKGLDIGLLPPATIKREIEQARRDILAEYARAFLERPPQPRRLYATAKRTLDVGLALAVLILTSPLWLAAAALVKLSSRGPVLYRQTRVGRNGQPFLCYKFRTMVNDADKILASDADMAARFKARWKLGDDRRITPAGRWLRKTSIDELPQLINVLRGEMSIVGPRPVQPEELRELFGPFAPVVTTMKPGLTSLWTVSGRSLTTYEERISLEVEYVRRRGFLYDLVLMAKTIPAVLTCRGAL